jgi:general secretion pathway protein I
LRRDGRKGQAGFTLLEALVALALVLAFAAVLGPHLSQARRIDAPFDRTGLANTLRKGGASELRWRIVAEPVLAAPPGVPDQPRWLPYRVTASVAWGSDQVTTAETIRLDRPAP